MSLSAIDELTRALLAGRSGGEHDAASMAAAVEGGFVRVASGLTRWFGAYGAQALMTRALAAARPAHPVLGNVSMTDVHTIEGIARSDSSYDAESIAEAMRATMTALAELLDRLIGDDLAITLLEQCITMPSPAPIDTRSPAVTQEPTTP